MENEIIELVKNAMNSAYSSGANHETSRQFDAEIDKTCQQLKYLLKKSSATKEKVIALLVKERKRGFDIAYAYKEEHETKAKYGPTDIRWVYEKIADLFRQAGNNISGGHAFSNDSMEERIAREYK